MEDGIDIRALWVGKSPLRVIGNLLLLWLGLLVALLLMLLPLVPETRSQWLWLIGAGPPTVLVAGLGYLRLGVWMGRKDPQLRLWESVLVVMACSALAVWFIHCIP